MTTKPPRKPDFVVRAKKDFDAPFSSRIGVAWHGETEDGTKFISIKLDHFIVLEGLDDPIITLFPWKRNGD